VSKLRDVGAAASLVLSPLLILAYWALYPAYGLLQPAAVLRSMAGHGGTAELADLCAFAGTFLAIPATLALMRVLSDRAPRLALTGGALSLAGWTAIMGVLMGDVLAIQMNARGEPMPSEANLYTGFMNSPFMLALNGVSLLHIVGGVVLGIALVRTRLIPRWAALAAAAAPIVHLGANLAGLFWVDAAMWVALTVVGGFVARAILQQGSGAIARYRRTGERAPASV